MHLIILNATTAADNPARECLFKELLAVRDTVSNGARVYTLCVPGSVEYEMVTTTKQICLDLGALPTSLLRAMCDFFENELADCTDPQMLFARQLSEREHCSTHPTYLVTRVSKGNGRVAFHISEARG